MSNHTIDLFSPQVRRDPFPVYAEMRAQRPVCRVEPGGFWAVSRYADVVAAFKDTKTFSSEGFRFVFRPPWLERNPGADSMLSMDPPEHTRLRNLVSKAFTPAVLAGVEPIVRDLAERLAGEIAGPGEVDFTRAFATPLAAGVLGHFLGLPAPLHSEFKRWVDDLVSITPEPLSEEHAARVRRTIAEQEKYCTELLEERRARPGNDMISTLLAAELEGQSLTQDELLSFMFLLLGAGFETTAHLLSKSMLLFADRADILARVRDDRSRIPRFVEEMLRYDPPTHGIYRQTTREVEVAGTTIPAGAFVALLLGSANRDPERFPDPDAFDLERDASGHIAFGTGPHVCIGLNLARLEARVALDTLLSRFARFERASDEIEWNHTLTVRGPAALPMRFLPA